MRNRKPIAIAVAISLVVIAIFVIGIINAKAKKSSNNASSLSSVGSDVINLGVGNTNEDTSAISFTCPVTEYISCELPSNSKNQIDTTGIFVCRLDGDDETSDASHTPACVASNEGLPTDQCGCCGDVCPLPCECPCVLSNGGGNDGENTMGVKVLIDDHDYWICIPRTASRTLVSNPAGDATCVEICNEE